MSGTGIFQLLDIYKYSNATPLNNIYTAMNKVFHRKEKKI